MKNKPDYGIDAPGVIRTFLLLALLMALAGWALRLVPFLRGPLFYISILLYMLGAVSFFFFTLMILYVLWGKFRMRNQMLNLISWRGDESVLDIGTGKGLLLIGAAKRLTTGNAVGIDIWSAKDLSGNSIQSTLENIEMESLKDKVQLKSEDARKLSFADNTFDVALSLLCIHNIEPEATQRYACFEIARVLKPGGKALIADYVPTDAYAKAFTEAGLKVVENKPYFATALSLMFMVTAVKER